MTMLNKDTSSWPQSHSEFIKRHLAGSNKEVFPDASSTYFRVILEYIDKHKEWLYAEDLIRLKPGYDKDIFFCGEYNQFGVGNTGWMSWFDVPLYFDGHDTQSITQFMMDSDNGC